MRKSKYLTTYYYYKLNNVKRLMNPRVYTIDVEIITKKKKRKRPPNIWVQLMYNSQYDIVLNLDVYMVRNDVGTRMFKGT